MKNKLTEGVFYSTAKKIAHDCRYTHTRKFCGKIDFAFARIYIANNKISQYLLKSIQFAF